MSDESWSARVFALVADLEPELALAEAQGLGARLVGAPLDPLLVPMLPAMESLEKSLAAAPVSTAGAHEARTAAISLLGAGFGLTPSGDDFLAGLLGTLRAARFQPAELLDGLIDEVVRAAPRHTTKVSAELLHGALSAQPPEVLQGFWSALFTRSNRAPRDDDAAALPAAIDKLRAHGTTSPWDFLCGVASAAQVQSDKERLQR